MRERVEFYNIKIDAEKEMAWVYSAMAFQELLNREFRGQSLKKLFVPLWGYVRCQKRSENYFDFSYISGPLLLVFNNSVLELMIHTDGMVEYRFIPLEKVQIPEYSRKDFPPSNTDDVGSSYYFDLTGEFGLSFVDETIKFIEVTKTDAYPFDLDGFDEELAAEAEQRCDLPRDVKLFMNNGAVLNLCAELEYYYIKATTEAKK